MIFTRGAWCFFQKTDHSCHTRDSCRKLKAKIKLYATCSQYMHGIYFFCFSLFHIQPFVHIHFIISVLQGPRRVENRAQRRYFARAKKKKFDFYVMLWSVDWQNAKRVSPFFTCHRPSPFRFKCCLIQRARKREISPTILRIVLRMKLQSIVCERESWLIFCNEKASSHKQAKSCRHNNDINVTYSVNSNGCSKVSHWTSQVVHSRLYCDFIWR